METTGRVMLDQAEAAALARTMDVYFLLLALSPPISILLYGQGKSTGVLMGVLLCFFAPGLGAVTEGLRSESSPAQMALHAVKALGKTLLGFICTYVLTRLSIHG